MATDPITLNDGIANVVYSNTFLNDTEARYRSDADSISEPVVLRLSHQIASSNKGIDRTLVQTQVTILDDDEAETPYTGTVNITLARPRKVITEAVMEAELVKAYNYAKSHISDLFRGVVP